MQHQAHVFSIFIPDFFSAHDHVDAIKDCQQPEVIHRLIKVLRYSVGDKIVFFDQYFHGLIQIEQILKKSLTVRVLSVERNHSVDRPVVFLLPLLKKEALEEAVYALAEIGATEIYLVTTQKSRQKLLHDKEFERLQAIIIAAAEQSKNYQFPVLHKPKDLWSLLDSEALSAHCKILFDGAGESFFQLRCSIDDRAVCLLVGPEGGLTSQELEKLQQQQWSVCGLTSTTLRAVQAVAVSVALFRLKS